MNNYKLVKNTEWKEVEINGEEKKVPIDWNIDTIGSSIKLNMGNTPKKELDNYSGDLPWITISNLTEKNIEQYTAKIKKTKNVKIFPKGTLLISFKMSVGKAGFTTEDSAINEAIMGIKPTDTINNIDYLYYCLPNVFISNAMPNGQGLLLLNQDKINNLNYIIPPIFQQLSIASILSQQESIIQDIENLISKYESRFQYISEKLLSGKIRVKEKNGEVILYKNPDDNWKEIEINGEMREIPKDWGNSTPKQLGFNIKTGKKDANAAQENGKYPFFTCSSNEILAINTYVFDTEAILISGNGSTLGEVRYYKGKFDVYQRTYVIDNIKNIFYMNHYFKKYFRESLNIIGGSIPFIKLGDIENFNILIPKENEIPLIVSILNQHESLINEQKNLFNKEKQKFEWLLDNLLSGKYLIKE